MQLKIALGSCALVIVFFAMLGLGPFSATPIHAQNTSIRTPTPTTIPDDALTDQLGDFLIVRYDPVRKIIHIAPIDPSVRIVVGNQADFLAPSNLPAPAPNTPTPSPTPLNATALRGKIIFKSTRGGGTYPNEFLYFLMNPDGTGVQRLDTSQARALLDGIQGLEGFSPDRTKVVMGDRACGTYFENECDLYILSTEYHAKMIFSDQEPSQGEWFGQPNVKAKEPVWSPRGDYIVFASNHEVPDGCRKTENLFKGTTGQNPVIRRLTKYCAGADTGRPSFSPDGLQVVYWSQFPGPDRNLFLIEVGTDDTFDWRSAQPKQITFEGDNWDPLWIK